MKHAVLKYLNTDQSKQINKLYELNKYLYNWSTLLTELKPQTTNVPVLSIIRVYTIHQCTCKDIKLNIHHIYILIISPIKAKTYLDTCAFLKFVSQCQS